MAALYIQLDKVLKKMMMIQGKELEFDILRYDKIAE